ncbi:MAG: F0F1 ATP synthase subunit A [Patescibacteria group bacterium]
MLFSTIAISLKAEELFHVGAFPVTNSVLLGVLVFGVLAFLGWNFRKRLAEVPSGIQNLLEFFLEGLLKIMDSVLGSRQKSEKYLPLVATIFLFVMLANWMGLLPGVGSIGLNEVREGHAEFIPLFRAPSADLNFTLALAVITVFSINLFGVLALGFRKHFGKFFTLKNPIYTFVGLLEFIAEIAKMVSFSFRLFGNVFAGEVLLIIIGALVPYFIPLPFLVLEIFVGFIQAFIFSMLTLVFLAIAIAEEGHEH